MISTLPADRRPDSSSVHRWGRSLLLAASLLGCLGGATAHPTLHAAETSESTRPTVEVRVSYVSGDSVFLDRGRRHGLRVGDVVRFPELGPDVEAEIVTVSSRTARARRVTEVEIATGARGRVELPPDRIVEADEPPVSEDLPTEPPTWERSVEPREEDQPLLAPAFGITPRDRPIDLRGRVFVGSRWTEDRAGANDVRDIENRIGTVTQIDNLFGIGGRVEVDLEWRQRTLDLDGVGRDSTSRVRLERGSYLWGWEAGAPARVEVGRFVSDDLPEVGVVDGVDVAARTAIGNFGILVGGYPEPGFERGTGNNATVAVYHRFQLGTERRFTFTSAYQHTWHRGDNDRDLVIGRLEWNPSRTWSLYSSAWVDFYSGSDRAKSAGPELTEFLTSLSYRPNRDHRFRLSISQSRWPDLERDEFEALPVTVRRGVRRQARLSTRHTLAEHLRLDTRWRAWSDQDDDGYGGEVTVRTPEWPARGWELLATVLYQQHPIGDRPGFRVGAVQSGRHHTIQLLYLQSDPEYNTLLAGSETRTSQRALAIFDWLIGERWTWSSQLESAFGDDESSVTGNVYLQCRF